MRARWGFLCYCAAPPMCYCSGKAPRRQNSSRSTRALVPTCKKYQWHTCKTNKQTNKQLKETNASCHVCLLVKSDVIWNAPVSYFCWLNSSQLAFHCTVLIHVFSPSFILGLRGQRNFIVPHIVCSLAAMVIFWSIHLWYSK